MCARVSISHKMSIYEKETKEIQNESHISINCVGLMSYGCLHFYPQFPQLGKLACKMNKGFTFFLLKQLHPTMTRISKL